jgi:PAS domain S-box-containing protein
MNKQSKAGAASEARPRKSTLSSFLIATCCIGFLLALGGYLYSREEYRNSLAAKLREITAIGSLKAGQIEQWRADSLADAVIAARSPFLAATVARLRGDPADEAVRASLAERLALYTKYGSWAEVAAYDLDGSRVDTPPGSKATVLDAVAMSLAKGALGDGGPRLRDIYRREEGGYSIDVIAPLRSGAGAPIGLLVLRKDPARQLFPLIQSWPIPSRSSETLLVRREGEEVVWLNTLRFSEAAPLSLRSPITRTDVPAVAAALGRIGSFSGLDYRGVPVVSDLRPIAGSPWYIVAKMDSSEATEEARGKSLIVLAAAFCLFIIATACLAFGRSRRLTGIYRSLYGEEKERADLHAEFSATLFGIGDGVISTNAEGKVRWINEAGERMTGWSSAEARGRSLDEVFRIYDEESGAAVVDPAGKVMRAGKKVALAKRAVLKSRDGPERAISDSGAPIIGEGGSIDGVVIVFRDISSERKARAKVEWLSAIVERSLNEIIVFDASSLRISYANRAALANLGYSLREMHSMTPLDIKPEFTTERFEEILAPLREGRSDAVAVATRNRRKDGSTYDVLLSIQRLDSREGRRFLSIGLDFTEQRRLEERLRKSLVERETLLREIHHRTKNNLQVVSSFISLAASSIGDPKVRGALGDIECRVAAMALAHERLYESDNLSRIELGPNLKSIAELALQSRDLGSKVRLDYEAAKVETSLDVASLVGLAVNELATNSAKYAFPEGRGGAIRLVVARDEEFVRIEYGDDGIGLPPGFEAGEEGHLGFTLLSSIVEHQLRGSLRIGSDRGFSCEIGFEQREIAVAPA